MSVALYAALNGLPVVRAHLTIPATGIWHADVVVDRTLPPVTPGPQVLTVADTTWTCAVVRSVDFAGIRELRLVGGTGGWRKTVLPRQYQGQAGVPAVTVTTDLAATVQEAPPVVVGIGVLATDYLRPGGIAGNVLQWILGDAWWMDPVGIIQTVPRPPKPVAFPFSAIAVEGAPGRYTIATENPSEWMPGAVFVGPIVSGTVSRTMHTVERGSLRTEVLIP